MKKVLAITGIRSDYDLMSNLYKKLNDSKDYELKLLVSGAHLSQAFGNTVELIEKDGFDILLKIESLINSDSQASRLKTASILLQNSIDIVAQYNPDLIIYPGDREEVLVGAMLGAFLRIPTAHFFGGEYTASGHVDNELRNAATKMSSIHFVSTIEQEERILKMGEAKRRIFTIGSPALDKFITEKHVPMKEIYNKFNIKKFEKYALVIFHSLDGSDKFSECFENILKALKMKNIKAFVSFPNTDPGNKKIIDIIEENKNDDNFYFYKNLDRNTFINIYRNAFFQIGNSSAGVVEAASVNLPAIDIGDRQKGRLSSGNVIHTISTEYEDIIKSIEKAIDPEFIEKCKRIKNVYGDGNSSENAFNILDKIDYNEFLLKLEDPNEL